MVLLIIFSVLSSIPILFAIWYTIKCYYTNFIATMFVFLILVIVSYLIIFMVIEPTEQEAINHSYKVLHI